MKETAIDLTTKEGRLLHFALGRLAELAPGHGHWEAIQEAEQGLASIIGPASTVSEISDLTITEPQLQILMALAGFRFRGPSWVNDRRSLRFHIQKRHRFQEVDLSIPEGGAILLCDVIGRICRTHEAWYKDSYIPHPPPDKDFAREIIFRSYLWNKPLAWVDQHWLEEGYSTEFLDRVNDYVNKHYQTINTETK